MRQNLIAGVLIVSLFAPFLFQDAVATSASQTESPIPTRSNKNLTQRVRDKREDVSQKVEYALPYPGLLPDHILYPLKVLRDRMLEFLIRDPLRKTDFYLLMADKRLNMGIYLNKKAKPALAEKTVSKGEKYFLKGVEQLERIVRSDGSELPETTMSRYKTASRKHRQELQDLKNNSPENLKSGYNSSLDIARKIQARLDKLGN